MAAPSRVLEAVPARRACSAISPPATPIKTRLPPPRQIAVPTTLVLGERDMMTPAKAGKALAAAIAEFTHRVLHGAGHMMMAERPDELLAALQA